MTVKYQMVSETKNKQGLIEYYEKRLAKVKAHHNPDSARTEMAKIRCNEYIEYATSQLEEVKNGRNW